MAESLTIARPYAEAAFQLAKGANALGPWSDALARLSAVAADPLVQNCIGNPKVSADQLTKLFLEVAGSDLSTEQKNFVRVLVENDRIGVLPEIRDLYVELKNAHEGSKEAVVTSAFELDDATLAKLKADLEKRFGCALQVSVTVDPSLIGGVKVAVGDEVIDASVRGKLAAMATALKN
ncbi:MAG: F0F1 ATP synthase subunit delta [Rhodocyclaceae bacterium]|nr:F0F1 ATP synthase subunit delta [Rhodocyclaceae bacterium]MBX3670382.1 F0F1 ATP synthase subunit delta [Rhodocyclaceae bacterium]